MTTRVGALDGGRHGSTSGGPGRVLVAVYAVFALAATSRAAYQLATKAQEAPLAYSLSAAAAAIYVVATVSLIRPGARPRRLAWVTISIELAGVLTVGALSLVEPVWFGDDTVWSRFGQGYLFIPLVLPVLGLWWLSRTRPVTA